MYSNIRGIESVRSLNNFRGQSQAFNGPTKNWLINHIFHNDVAIKGTLIVNKIMFGALYPNLTIRAHTCDTTDGWDTLASSGWTVSTEALSYMPVETGTAIRLTKSGAAGADEDAIAFFEFSEVQDLSLLDYIGFFYKGKTTSNTYSNDSVRVCLISDTEDFYNRTFDVTNVNEIHDIADNDWTENSTNVTWKYSEIALSDNRQGRQAIKGIGFFYNSEATDPIATSDAIDIALIDIYKLGTKYGPVRGPMIALPLADGYLLEPGELAEINSEGKLRTPSALTDNFAGIVVRHNINGSRNISHGHSHGNEQLVLLQHDGVINFPLNNNTVGYVAKDGLAVNTKDLATSGAIKNTIFGVLQRDTVPQGGVAPLKLSRLNEPSSTTTDLVVTKTTTYTAISTDYTILCDATAGAFTVTLPSAVGISGRKYVIKKIDSSVNNITIDGNALETIDGATTYTLNTQYKSIYIISNGTNWYIVSNN